MPVRFKGTSEYDSNYNRTNFLQSNDGMAPIAGLSSPKISQAYGFQSEPAILRKKKPIPLVTTSTTKMFLEDVRVPDDYMLLGSQDKFSSNVPYKDYLIRNRTRVLGTTYVEPEQPEPQSMPKPLAKIDFDTGARKKSDMPEKNLQDLEVKGNKISIGEPPVNVKVKESVTAESGAAVTSNSDKPSNERMSKTRVIEKPVAEAKSGEKQSKVNFTDAAVVPPQPENSAQVPQQIGPKPVPVRKQDDNVDNSYAMKYRAGIAPVRTSNKRKSEYAYKYDWKKPIENAPLLAADKIVHNSNHNIGYAKDQIPKRSEYQKQYKAWTYRPVVTQDETTPDQIRKTITSAKMRKARSEMNLSPDKLPAAGSPSRIQHDNQRLTQSLNPQKPFFPLRRTVSWTSEYMSNFQPFSSFEYQQGAWKNSNPPHLNQANPVQKVPRERSDSWLLEVKELRDKAEEYRKRSLGTHFSRAHVGQLLSENSKLWDMVSVSSELSALDLEQSQVTAKSPTENTQPKKRERTQSAQAVLNPGARTGPSKKERERTGVLDDSKVRKRLAWSSDGSRSASPSDSARSIRSSNPSITTDQVQEKSAESGSQDSESTENGRVQTPEIVTSPVVRRHHLDVTTPNRHGLLLSGPIHHSPKESRQSKSQRATKEDAAVTQNTRKRNDALEVVVPSQEPRKILLSPTYGKPTEDAHDLLDEDIPEPVDVILETRYVQSPSKKSNLLNPVLEGAGMTYNISKMNLPDRKREDDEMSHSSQFSDSMMSVISNSSQRANDTLLKAARRQKEFWRTDNF